MAEANPSTAKAREQRILNQALAVLEGRVRESRSRYRVTGTSAAQHYLRVRLGALEREVFLVLFLDNQGGVIAIEELFQGTLAQITIHGREVLKAALRHNAASVILAHNHPSGAAEFSEADLCLRRSLAEALGYIDVKILDFLVVAGADVVSLAEQNAIEECAERDALREADQARRERQSAAMKAAWARRRERAARGG
jgi:DNA repair protein RadC